MSYGLKEWVEWNNKEWDNFGKGLRILEWMGFILTIIMLGYMWAIQ